MNAKNDGDIPHLRTAGGATQLIVDGRPFVMLAGEVRNSSSSSLDYMEPIWDRLAALHLNTVLVTASWELVEPREGQVDFDLIDGLIGQVRHRELKLVILWFGTWKNALSTYAPAWVKTDLGRFPRAQAVAGVSSGAISPLCREAREADARAFAALMRHVRQADRDQHTVLMMQVENETGLLGASRDHSPPAVESFAGAVPPELMAHLAARGDELTGDLARPWRAAGGRTEGTWAEVFGDAADEVFMAWHVGRFVERVAAAGKAEYPLPMYANAWLVGHDGQPPGKYPSGGPVAKMMDVWQAAAPSIDCLAPDIYRPDFAAVCAEYHRSGNPLLIPEARRDASAAANAFYAFARHDAICFAPFAIDDVPPDHPLGAVYELLGGMMDLITAQQGTGRMVGLLQQGPSPRELELGGYRLSVRFPQPPGEATGPGGGLAIATGPGEYIIAGMAMTITFCARPGEGPNVDFLSVEEGRFVAGQWRPGRRLNGDEFYGGVILGAQPGVRRVKVYSYA